MAHTVCPAPVPLLTPSRRGQAARRPGVLLAEPGEVRVERRDVAAEV